MKKVITIIITFAMLFAAHAAAEAAFDLSGMTEAELAALIEAAQAELDARSANENTAGQSGDAETDGGLVVSEARLLVQSEEYKSLYPDVLQAILVNNTQSDIKDAVVAFVAWDENNLPVLLKGQFDYNPASYVRRASYTGINMVPGSTYGENTGMRLDESINGIVTVKAIVVSYVTFEGETWENPEFAQFIEEYEGKKLLQ